LYILTPGSSLKYLLNDFPFKLEVAIGATDVPRALFGKGFPSAEEKLRI
jgi:hypothetical protein